MKEVEAVNQTYELIKLALDEHFSEQGYLIALDKEEELIFGGRYVIWSDNRELIRLTWDGKENIFLIETSKGIPLTLSTQWTSISITTFNPNYENNDYCYAIAKKVIDSMN